LTFLRTSLLGLSVKKQQLTSTLNAWLYGGSNLVEFPKLFTTFSYTWFRKTTDLKSASSTALHSLQILKYTAVNTPTTKLSILALLYKLVSNVKASFLWFLQVYTITIGDGFLYLRGLFIIFFVDALIADDEPLWEPIEWSLLQSWILFIFLFAWIAENLISSRYGSYTGRDKRVWFAWYKTFWLIEGWYILSMGAASLWVMVPHYYEVTYGVSFIYSWWNWYSRVFFFKFISIFTIILFVAYFLQISLRWVNWKKSFYLILFINFFLGYLIYTQFFISFFAYFTDPRWHSKTRLVDYIQLSHEPSRWGWGDVKRDHFTHHRSKTVFWFKNDGPFASAFMFYNFMFFLSLFTLYFYWLTLIRRVYVTQEVTYTYTTYCISSLKQFFYFFMLLFVFVLLSYMFIYWRTPNEFIWTINSVSWFGNFWDILLSYPELLLSVFRL
jgi:hypothetical protein